MKIIEENPVTLLAEDNCILIPKGKTFEKVFLSNTMITLAKDANKEDYEEINIDDIPDISEQLSTIDNDLQEE